MIQLIGLSFVLSFLREVTILAIVIRSTSNMHREMAQKILRSKVVFFDANPIGRILTRFSKDMAVLDLIVPHVAVLISYGLFRTASVAVALCIVNYWLLIPLTFIVSYFIYIVRRSVQAMVEA